MEVHFSPHGMCVSNIVAEIEKAKEEIKIQAYTFSNKKITEALISKKQLKIRFIGDNLGMQMKGCTIADLNTEKIECYIDDKHKISHNKIIIIDKKTIITGSFNFTENAENTNAENLIIIRNEQMIIDKYLENWNDHLTHSKKFIQVSRTLEDLGILEDFFS